MSYNTEPLLQFSRKHPNNYTQLFHMAVSNYVANIIQIPNVSDGDLLAASNDVGIVIDSYLASLKKNTLLPNSQVSSFRVLSNAAATYGNYVAALLYQQALLVGRNDVYNISNIIIALLQSAGNKPILVDASNRMMREYINDLVRYTRNRRNANVVQLHSFNIANHMIRLLS